MVSSQQLRRVSHTPMLQKVLLPTQKHQIMKRINADMKLFHSEMKLLVTGDVILSCQGCVAIYK